MKEADLFEPVKKYLEANGYNVRAEVKNCDITATKDDELIIIELKLNINLSLLIQATDRQRITDAVYVAVPRKVIKNRKRWKGAKHVLRRLELGLLLVDRENFTDPVELVFHPIKFQRKKLQHRKKVIIKEIAHRSGNLNVGGINRRKIVTAYRENAIQIAVCLSRLGATTPKVLRKYECGRKTTSILYHNFYGWFERVEHGIYDITVKGTKELKKFPSLSAKYKKKLAKKLSEKSGT